MRVTRRSLPVSCRVLLVFTVPTSVRRKRLCGSSSGPSCGRNHQSGWAVSGAVPPCRTRGRPVRARGPPGELTGRGVPVVAGRGGGGDIAAGPGAERGGWRHASAASRSPVTGALPDRAGAWRDLRAARLAVSRGAAHLPTCGVALAPRPRPPERATGQAVPPPHHPAVRVADRSRTIAPPPSNARRRPVRWCGPAGGAAGGPGRPGGAEGWVPSALSRGPPDQAGPCGHDLGVLSRHVGDTRAGCLNEVRAFWLGGIATSTAECRRPS